MINQIMTTFVNYVGIFLMMIGILCIIMSIEVKALLLGAVFVLLGFIILCVSYQNAPTLFIMSRSI